MKLYGFFHTTCIYESAHALISLHTTKRGAWKAMQKHQWNAWENIGDKNTGFHMGRDYWQMMRCRKAYVHCASRVMSVDVVVD